MRLYVSNRHSEDKRIALVSESHALIFQAINGFDTRSKSCSLTLVPREELKNQGYKRLTYREIFGFIGLIEVDNNIFIGTITGASKVASPIPGETVNKIYAVDFHCLTDSRWDFIDLDSQGRPLDQQFNNHGNESDNDTYKTNIEGYDLDRSAYSNSIPLQQHPCYQYKKLLSNGSFFYSADFDITSILQDRGLINSKKKHVDNETGTDNISSTECCREEFMWNNFMLREIMLYRDRADKSTQRILDKNRFLTTIIRGFAETVITYIQDWKVSMTIISKQSWKRAGTRYNVRGIDDDGHVANFVENEFILYSNEYGYSYTQVRGSVPLFWEQDASLINPKIQITRSVEATRGAFDLHFQDLAAKYGTIHIVNLLSDKPSEFELTKRYRRQLSVSKSVKLDKQVLLTEFDFHRETSQDGFLAARKLIPIIKTSILNNGYFSFDVRENKIISKQSGCFRTNCLDCLDRTNLVQQLLSYEILKLFLTDFNIVSQSRISDNSEYIKKHNILWADHGDQISQIYTGTNALKSSFTRKGKMSLAGAISDATKSVSRLYLNNFVDKGKQQNIDGLLGKLSYQRPVEIFDPENTYITEELNKFSEEFTTFSNMNLFVGTYNVGGRSNKHADLSEWLFPIGDKFKPDIVVLGLQEVIELTASSILNVDYSKNSLWENLVMDCLNKYEENYVLLRAEQMASLIILLFVKEDKMNHVKQVEGSTKKTGFKGMTGNKGAVAIRFNYSDTSFCFVNAHLSAGANNIEERANDYLSISKNISFTGGRTIDQHDSIFWLGDFNYRIDLDNFNVRKKLSEQQPNYIESLLRYDQLTQVLNAGQIFPNFCEPTLQFHPTYKYDVGTDLYDTSEKARTPSWTDRIIYRGSNLHPLAYSDAPLKLSDHRPVFAAYRVNIAFINDTKKLSLINQLQIDYKNQKKNIHKNIQIPQGINESKDISLVGLTPRSDIFLNKKVKASNNQMKDGLALGKHISADFFAPNCKSNLNKNMISNSNESLSTTNSMVSPPPPLSRASKSIKSTTNIGSTRDPVELKPLNNQSSTSTTSNDRVKKPLPSLPPSRKITSSIPDNSSDDTFEYEDSLLLGHAIDDSDDELSSMLEMVVDSSSPRKVRSTNPPTKDIQQEVLQLSSSEPLLVKGKIKLAPPVPTKKASLKKINIEK
ncbi:phosphatidylinositol-3-/phosphoinositide 5-phosphatase INP52 PWA37_003440 [Arxiozyma heterogenica]|uniref:phosphatidylinositol-3-/phosphoinositide 5-phosphatase INP52 n=1 Tax=Arxiozyma heterogenica TaxID=278026 RepID=UPI002EDFFC45